MPIRDYILVALFAYLCGSIPFGYLLVRVFKGADIRQSGSGNIGATNVARTAPALGVLTLLLDAIKGFAAVYAAAIWSTELLPVAALFVVLGHMFPVWLGFRGGKGVATAAGAYVYISPLGLGCAFLVFLLVFLISKYVSLGSIAAAVAFPAFAYGLSQVTPGLLAALCVVSVLVIAKHHANIRRLLAGTENRFARKKTEQVVAED